MIFQRVLKGIAGVDQGTAEAQLNGGGGIICNWWHQVNPLPTNEIPARLTADNLLRHVSAYDDPDPATGRPFREMTPFISTTAGAVERDHQAARNVKFNTFLTALGFATRGFRESGAVFYGYVNVLGRQAVGLREFAEETRELNLWNEFQEFHAEGEIVAKIDIPAAHLELAEGYDGPNARAEWDLGRFPPPTWVAINRVHYVLPEAVCNIRDVL